MTSYIRHPLTMVWAVLVLITLASWLTAHDGGADHVVNVTVTVVVVAIAIIKAQLVIWHFMEVRHSPTWLRISTSSWVLVMCALLVGIYLSAVP